MIFNCQHITNGYFSPHYRVELYHVLSSVYMCKRYGLVMSLHKMDSPLKGLGHKIELKYFLKKIVFGICNEEPLLDFAF